MIPQQTQPTQLAHPVRTTVRTVVQVLVGLAAVLPFVYEDLGISGSAGLAAVVLGVAAAVTRIMAIPAVNTLLDRYLALGPGR